jgi:plastocyanin
VLAVLATLVLAACADDGPDAEADVEADLVVAAPEPEVSATDGDLPASGATPTGVVHPVIALDNSFRPQQLEIAVGDEVEWENRGINEHNVLSIEGDTWGVEVDDFQPGAVYSHVFDEPGEYRYYCSIHGSDTVGMVGTITVTG